MKRTPYPGASCADALATGERVIVYPRVGIRIEPAGQMVLLPPNEPEKINYVAISQVSPQTFAGQAQTVAGRTWEHTFNGWRQLHFVTGQGIYDAHGFYRDQVGGMAFLADDGRVVSRHENYAARHGVSNWVERVGLLVGFAQDRGVVVYELATGITRVLDDRPMAPIDVRFHVAGSRFVIVYVVSGAGVQIVDGELHELRSLPIKQAGTPTPKPQPTPQPIPEPEPVSIPNRFDIVQRISLEHPHLIAQNTPETIRELYWRIAWALHQSDPSFGMLSKSAGENGHEIPGAGRVSVDAVAYKDATPIVDIFGSAGDGPGLGRLTWNVDEHRRESNLWVQPPPFPSSQPDQPPTEEPDPIRLEDLKNLIAMIDRLLVDNEKLRGEIALKASNHDLQAVSSRVETLERQPAVTPTLPMLKAAGHVKVKLRDLYSEEGIPVSLPVVSVSTP